MWQFGFHRQTVVSPFGLGFCILSGAARKSPCTLGNRSICTLFVSFGTVARRCRTRTFTQRSRTCFNFTYFIILWTVDRRTFSHRSVVFTLLLEKHLNRWSTCQNLLHVLLPGCACLALQMYLGGARVFGFFLHTNWCFRRLFRTEARAMQFHGLFWHFDRFWNRNNWKQNLSFDMSDRQRFAWFIPFKTDLKKNQNVLTTSLIWKLEIRWERQLLYAQVWL